MNIKGLQQEYTSPISPRSDSPDDKTVLTRTISEDVIPMAVELQQTGCEVSRRVINQPVDEIPEVRYEGDSMIVPVVEERLVKQLFLLEEVVVAPTTSTQVRHADVPLRREQVHVAPEATH